MEVRYLRSSTIPMTPFHYNTKVSTHLLKFQFEIQHNKREHTHARMKSAKRMTFTVTYGHMVYDKSLDSLTP